MAETLLYHNPRCSKSRQALALLQEKGVEPAIVEYLKTPPSAAGLKSLLDRLGLKAADVLRRKEGAEAGLTPDMPEAALIAGIAAHPAALERPIFVHGGRAVVGRPPERVLDLL
ncbi:arsenate reductase (glutaredoxin) [Ferrovibrio sp.]|uniref:arsenate reductase (glutaredoxin) n=1 Tax=Ferrovibrio sp. TaxID=1917215 RepID=UPI00311F32B6